MRREWWKLVPERIAQQLQRGQLPQGPPGVDGADGADGLDGADGGKGDTGEKGDPGDASSIDTSGFTGPLSGLKITNPQQLAEALDTILKTLIL